MAEKKDAKNSINKIKMPVELTIRQQITNKRFIGS